MSRGSYGVVAMAAYKPDLTLFRAQLESIQKQTHSNFDCLISVDGDPGPIRDFVEDTLSDPRFQVLGFDDRLGFYGNFERVLSQVPPHAQWVALSDQDDYWYPKKLETLLPHLETHDLVSGQARVVEAQSGRVVAETTGRRNVAFSDLVIQNQVTGGQTVFRRSLLALALPFPRLNTVTEVHDHWLAVCAGASGSVLVVEEIVQDYVQHGSNVLGEVAGGFDPGRSVRRVVSLAEKFEGGRSPAKIAAACRKLSYGWRAAMVDTLAERLEAGGKDFRETHAAFSSDHRWLPTLAMLLRGARRGAVAPACLAEFVSGTPAEVLRVLPRRSKARGDLD